MLSILTTALPDRHPQRLMASVRDLACLVELEWIVHIDGSAQIPPAWQELQMEAASTSNSSLRLDIQTCEHALGPAAERAWAMQRARGEYILAADDDDWLYPEGVRAVLQPLAQDQILGWAAGQVRQADGECFAQALDTGLCTPEKFVASWPDPQAQLPLLMSAIIARRSLAVLVGGWGSLPRAESIAYLARLGATSLGQVLDVDICGYGDAASRSSEDHLADELEAIGRQQAHTQMRRLAEAGWLWPSSHSVKFS